MTLPRDLVANPRLSTWVSVTDDGRVGVRVGKVELGQGITTALAQVAADALGVGLDEIRMLPAHTSIGPDEGLTAGSLSVLHAAPALRVLGAHVRALVEARRGGDPEASFAELLAGVDLDVDVTDGIDPIPQQLVGTAVRRLDLPDKVTGRPRYIADLRPPGLLFGRVVRPPSPGAQLLDASAAFDADVTVIRDGSFLGLLGPDEAVVDRAVERLRASATWKEQDTLPDEDDLVTFLRAGPHDDLEVLDDEAASDDGGADGTVVRAEYSRPFLAHASIAPSCGMAQWSEDGVHVWSHTQGVFQLRDAIAAALSLDPGTVVVEHVENAGCYGHNAADDAAFDAVLLARAAPGRPVQVRWSRQDELTWAPFGSAMSTSVSARLREGRIVSWDYDVWSQGHTSRPGYAGVPGLLAGSHLATPTDAPAASDPPPAAGWGTARNAVPIYDVGPRRITGHRLRHTPIRSSALRALGAFTNVFSIESFMDELALEVGVDPLELRLAHLTDGRARTVLETAAAAAGWADPTEEGSGRGIGFARYKDKGAYCAVVADVAAEAEIRVRRLTIAVDVGLVVNPDGVRNQIEGGATQATSWTCVERVRFDRRRITSADWESYPILRFGDAPVVDVHLVDRPDLPSVGAGEAAQGPTAAAIANAVTAALGVRVRDLPLTRESVVRAIENS